VEAVPRLSWVVPMYRTSEFLEPLCARASDAARALQLPCELVLVDDACPEGSANLAQELIGRYPIRLLRLPRNEGQDAAIRAGLRVCRGTWALILDADLQDPPEALTTLWPFTADYDAIFADRVGEYESRARLISSRLYRRCMEFVGGLPHGAGLFVLLNRKLIDTVAATRRPCVSILAVIAAARGHYVSVPVPRASRPKGTSGYSNRQRWHKGVLSLCQTFAAQRLRMRL
jgi:glycosyltransferase involved in cell wall biosynthesis